MCKFHSGGSAYFSDGFSQCSSVLVDIYTLRNPLRNLAPERHGLFLNFKTNLQIMKFLIYLFLFITALGCRTEEKSTNFYIQNFFDSNTQVTCIDSSSGKFYLKFLHSKMDTEIPVFKFVIPDSIQFSDFYNAYLGRITDIYYQSISSDSTKSIDSLFISSGCDAELVKKNVITYYQNDPVFAEAFSTALNSYYNDTSIGNSKAQKINISLDSLINIALLQFDIFYVPQRGFAYHFVCGVNPYDYSVNNKANLLIPGFCQEALRNKKMFEVHSQAINQILEKNRTENDLLLESGESLSLKYQDELRNLLTKEGTLKEVLLEYYDKRKNIEAFEIKDES